MTEMDGMTETDHSQWRDDVAAHLLGALEPAEAAELERHMAGCAECQAYLRRLRPAADMLPGSVEPVEAPSRLGLEILGQVRSEAAARGTTRERRMPFGGRRWLQGWRPLAIAGVAGLMLAALAGYAIRDSESAGGGATTIAAGGAPAVTAELVMENESAVLRLANLHEMPDDKVLEAWVRRDGRVERAGGLFVPDSAGRAMATIPDMHGVEAVMVTAEPKAGSTAPTSSPMVTARIKSG